MKITRRKFIIYSAVGLSANTINAIADTSAATEFDWKATCREWMSVILPSDEFGPGADTPIVWELLYKLMENKPETKQWLVLGLKRLSKMELPKNKEQLAKMQRPGQPYASIIRFLNKIFIEYYFSSPPGWKELGITSPPQPKGFAL